jgi:hypothetical protein
VGARRRRRRGGLGSGVRKRPAAQTISLNAEIAFQANTGSLYLLFSADTGLGMMPGTSPSVDPSAIGLPIDNHDQCRHGGWRSFGFKKQRDCMRFVKLFQ